MSDLSIESIRLKIETVERDIRKLESEGNGLRKVEALTEYKKYLEDELRMLENDHRS